MHYVSPTDDNRKQAERMKALCIYSEVSTEIGDVIVAQVNAQTIAELIANNREQLTALISKTSKFEPK